MKIILTTVTLTLSLIFVLSIQVKAQSPNNLYVAPYLTNNDLTIIFDNSSQVLEYIAASDNDQPVAIFLATTDQFNTLKSKGIRPELIEENADLSRFIYLYHRDSNQASKLAQYGEVFTINNHYFLLKLKDPDNFEFSGSIVEYNRLPLGQIVKPPIENVVETPSQQKNQEGTSIMRLLTQYWYVIAGLTIAIVSIVLFKLYQKNKQEMQ